MRNEMRLETWDDWVEYLNTWWRWLKEQQPGSVPRADLIDFEIHLLILKDKAPDAWDLRARANWLWEVAESKIRDCGAVRDVDRRWKESYGKYLESMRAGTREQQRRDYEMYVAADKLRNYVVRGCH